MARLRCSPYPSSDLSLPERDRRWRWAVFCVVVADYVCQHEGIASPAWVTDPRYALTEPWYAFDDRGDRGDRGDRTVGAPLTPEAQS